MSIRQFASTAIVAAVLVLPSMACAQGTAADYTRAEGLAETFRGLVVNTAEGTTWARDSSRLWYRRAVKGGNEFVLVDPKAGSLAPAFDHAQLSAALNTAATPRTPYTQITLPFQTFTFGDQNKAIEFTAAAQRYRCDIEAYTCAKTGAAPAPAAGRGNGMGPLVAPGTAGTQTPAAIRQLRSPDEKYEAFIRNHNVWVREVGRTGSEKALSTDGSEGDSYALHTGAWSPDSKKLAVNRTRPGYRRVVNYIESSPTDQIQPKLTELYYQKPGDQLAVRTPVLFNVETGEQAIIDRALFPNAYSQTNPTWWKDGRGVRINYNQRGHQVFRILDIDATTKQVRPIVDERAATYISYSNKQYISFTPDEKELVWMSERDGWNHLYLYDVAAGAVKNQITKGDWAVKAVQRVDHDKRQIYFTGVGKEAGQDPYYVHYYRINFDGTGLVALTKDNGTHAVTWSPDNQFYIDSWSRVDMAPVAQLKRAEDQSVVAELGRGDLTALKAAGWIAPEPFVAKGRDGKTDIFGVIIRPTNFDPKKKYPVIENIYAGPQDSFTPKSFSAMRAMHAQAELGFIVVQVDGMGTSNRSKAFHDVSWKNLGDGGFPDRILWHKAIAAKYPWYDITRTGIYGGSAGGQNALAALLFHPDFYDTAVAFAGSHDNRMDKIWWNEQYMGWPIGPEYSKASNVDNAHRLQGKLLLIVGELDTNVDPSSSYQVANALIRANKTFDFLFLPGTGHSEGGRYGERRRWDFFVDNLLNVQPPNRNLPRTITNTTTAGGAPATEDAAP